MHFVFALNVGIQACSLPATKAGARARCQALMKPAQLMKLAPWAPVGEQVEEQGRAAEEGDADPGRLADAQVVEDLVGVEDVVVRRARVGEDSVVGVAPVVMVSKALVSCDQGG